MRNLIRPAAVKLGITEHLGWHTFRHTYSSLLRATGVDIKVMQELLRHASSRVTLDTYTQAVTLHKRKARSDVIRLFCASAMRHRGGEPAAIGGRCRVQRPAEVLPQRRRRL
jgi:integrase